MSMARVSEISATSSESFEDAITQGLARANKMLHNVRRAWVKEQVQVTKGAVAEYQVNMTVTFVSDDRPPMMERDGARQASGPLITWSLRGGTYVPVPRAVIPCPDCLDEDRADSSADEGRPPPLDRVADDRPR
jgi:flavin-binding protein dodecin